ncbi:MAG TPA: glycosyl hydrolase [Gammaproteobacteria bacterium]
MYKMVDADATPQTRALLANLYRLRHDHLLFGHQDSLAYGVEWIGGDNRSDPKAVTGSHAAVIGWDVGGLELGNAHNLDGVDFGDMQHWIRQAYLGGGVVTISWHMADPVSGGSSWNKGKFVHRLIPGGDLHETLKSYLDTFAAFNEQLKVTVDGEEHYIPVIFRPWHEHTGDWFWWGKGNAREEDYIALWRFTVEYLRDVKHAHNLIYAYSPDRSRIDLDDFESGYLYSYPGDDYVDVFGLDNYHDLRYPADAGQREQFARSLQYLVELANRHNKLPAMTEGGQETVPDDEFWTGHLLAGILANGTTRQIAYAMVWRNANKARENKDHFYAAYPGHPSAADFVKFYKHPSVLFQDKLPDMYQAR